MDTGAMLLLSITKSIVDKGAEAGAGPHRVLTQNRKPRHGKWLVKITLLLRTTPKFFLLYTHLQSPVAAKVPLSSLLPQTLTTVAVPQKAVFLKTWLNSRVFA